MPIYRYKAVSEDGKVLEGYYEGDSKADVLDMLKNNSYYPVLIEEDMGASIKTDIFARRITKKDMAVFCRQFYTMLNAGISIVNCLDVLKEQTQNNTFKKTIFSVYEDVQKGMTLSESMNKYEKVFPSLLANMVEVGETSGTLDVIMERMAVHYEKENRIENKIRSAFVYPAVLSIVAIAVVIFLLIVVMPSFISMFESNHMILPTPTRALLAISNWLKAYWYLFIGAIFAIAISLRILGTTPRGRLFYDSIKLKTPILNKLSINIVTSRFTRTMSTLLSSGIALLQAMNVVSNILGNEVVSQRLDVVKEDIRKGIPMSRAIETMDIFPPMVDSMIRVGEESGAIDDILDKTADFYDEEVDTSIQRMTTLLEPMLIVVMAVIIGFIVISIAMPMFDMVSTAQM
ncbi:MAG TPA: type II secretion system F family protein [Tepidimicrobium sp.]|nr:type II secretion system F family protein [Tepidimicrobium sp.]